MKEKKIINKKKFYILIKIYSQKIWIIICAKILKMNKIKINFLNPIIRLKNRIQKEKYFINNFKIKKIKKIQKSFFFKI